MSRAETQRSVVAIVPARFDSSRFPGKPLAPIAGLPMIAHVVRRAAEATLVDEVWVATDDARIERAARAAGARVVLTSSAHRSGTDRVAEAAERLAPDIVINVQGDEPLIDPRSLDRLAEALLEDAKLEVATLGWPLRSPAEWRRPDVVKVVVAEDGRALYFSRAPVPCDRERAGELPAAAMKHIGIYGYRRGALARFVGWGPSALERLEALEQLRFLEHGVRIQVVRAASNSLAVDRPEDVARVEAALERRASKKETRRSNPS